MAVASAAAAAGAAVVAHGVQKGLIDPHGVRLTVFLIGIVICGAGIYLLQRGLRRRARIEAIRALLPRTFDRRRAWASGSRDTGRADPFGIEALDWGDDPGDVMPRAHAEIRAATRALLVSLEEEMRTEAGRVRRAGRPACRRARLRVAGRNGSQRRRVPVRFASSPS